MHNQDQTAARGRLREPTILLKAERDALAWLGRIHVRSRAELIWKTPKGRYPVRTFRLCLHIGLALASLAALTGLGVQYALRSTSQASAAEPAQNGPNLMANGSFEQVEPGRRAWPVGWRTGGKMENDLIMTQDAGPEGRKALKLVCNKFVPGSPTSLVMAVTRGPWVNLKKGQAYRLTWFAKAAAVNPESDPPFSAKVDIGRNNPWKMEFGKSFRVYSYWKRYETEFESPDDLTADNDRLAFYTWTTGVLWLSDVSLVEIPETPMQWLPQIDARNVTNLLPNSSFECGRAGWGGFSPEVNGGGGTVTNLPEMPGDIDETTGWHGRKSLRIHLDRNKPLVFRTVIGGTSQTFTETALTQAVANVGWVHLSANTPYTFSCYVKVDQPPAAVRLIICKSGKERTDVLGSESPVVEGTDWKRVSMTVRPTEDTPVWVAAGLDIGHTPAPAATLWVDALQFEKGDQATAYAPRSAVESFVTSDVPGNIFTDPALGMDLSIRASNSGGELVVLVGRLSVTDFFDQEVLAMDVALALRAQGIGRAPLKGLLKGRKGFFRVAWKPQDPAAPVAQTLRCSVIDRHPEADSVVGMNYHYPWPVLTRLAREGGLVWVRDWSASWENVEPEQGKWDYSIPDGEIDSERAIGLDPMALLPFPSAQWASGADRPTIEKISSLPWKQRRLICASAPRDQNNLKTYITRTVDHYKDRVKVFEIFNEPIHTSFSLPKQLGYRTKDYVALEKVAYEAAKAANPAIQVIGGVADEPDIDLPLVEEFINQGGLQYCDIMNLHWYPDAAKAPEGSEKNLAEIEDLMRTRNQVRPIWNTEFGAYADDDPPNAPYYINGEATGFNRANWWSSEQAAGVDMVKYCVIMFAHGTKKVLFFRGNSAPINGGLTVATSDWDGTFFKYGGAPRKMYAAISAMANILGPDLEPAGADKKGAFYAYWFRMKKGSAAVVWRNDFVQGAEEGKAVPLRLPPGVSAFDLLGNKVEGETVSVGDAPVYLLAADDTVWKGMFQETAPKTIPAAGR